MPVRGVRRRYIGFRVDADAKLTEEEIFDAINSKALELYGVKGASTASLSMISYNGDEGRGIIRCSHDSLRRTRTALAMISIISGSSAAIRVDRVSGTIKSLRLKNC
jgi:RNase P/RNase MRP subunit POP5